MDGSNVYFLKGCQEYVQPIQLHFQLADLLGEGSLQRFLVLGCAPTLTGQQPRSLFQDDFLPLGDLDGMHPILGRSLMERPLAPERFQDHFCLTLPTMLAPQRRHRFIPPVAPKTNVFAGPNSGKHYTRPTAAVRSSPPGMRSRASSA